MSPNECWLFCFISLFKIRIRQPELCNLSYVFIESNRLFSQQMSRNIGWSKKSERYNQVVGSWIATNLRENSYVHSSRNVKERNNKLIMKMAIQCTDNCVSWCTSCALILWAGDQCGRASKQKFEQRSNEKI